jgi:hypothetical protein
MTKLTTTWNSKLAILERAISVIEACLTVKKIKHSCLQRCNDWTSEEK